MSIRSRRAWMAASTAASTASISCARSSARLELRARRDHDPVVVGDHQIAGRDAHAAEQDRPADARRDVAAARHRRRSRAPTAAAAAARCGRARSRRRRSRPARGAQPRSPAARRARPAARRRPGPRARRRARPRRSRAARRGTRRPPRRCRRGRRSAPSVSGRIAGSTTGSDLSTSQSVLTGTAARASMGRGLVSAPDARDRRHLPRTDPQGPARRRHPPDAPTACARRCSRSSATASRSRACSICSPARARSASKRSRAGADSVTFVDDDRSRDHGRPGQPAGARRGRRRATRRRPALPQLRIEAAAPNTILCSSTPHTGMRSASRPRCRRPSPPCWRPGRWPWPRATDGRRWRSTLPLTRRTPLRRHTDPHLWPLTPASPSAPAPTTR